MPKFEVTYKCSNSNCGYQESLEINESSIAAAWKASGPVCPAHELSGDMKPVAVKEIGN